MATRFAGGSPVIENALLNTRLLTIGPSFGGGRPVASKW
jgi:hypothetical protein